jgi:class 3 adenylate cyclase/tetratricopeptide (TPR) repeat protein
LALHVETGRVTAGRPDAERERLPMRYPCPRLAVMRLCARCGQENPEHARFCLACGEPLGGSQPGRLERKFATALFADLVGSTSLAEREDPEVVQSVIGRAFDRLAEEIARHEGLLEKFMGDAILAVFGVPRAHEDDAERAVLAAMEMQGILSELNRDFAVEGRPELAMRVGVEAGEVLVDVERASGPRDRMLTGDAVNVAARLQSAADPGRVVVGPGVHEATKDVIEYRELAPLELKGKADPVPAWEALRVRAKQRGERPELGMEARLIGRDEELAVLTQTFQRVQDDRRPALVTVVGPAGVGKSRLTRDFERHVEGLPAFVYWRRGRCLAYGNTAYSAIADAIKAQCEILDDDATDVVLKKTEEAVKELFGDTEIAPEIGALVGTGEPGAFKREDLFDAWRRFLERLAARYPLVLVFEDIHWADDGVLDFIEYLADWAQGPILAVALARPELFENRSSWGGGHRNAASIFLDPLSAVESAAMLDDLLAGGMTDELERAVVERSEGNPLYVEEIVRKLVDDGVLRVSDGSRWEVTRPTTEVELPRSIQGLIATRLDGLPADEKAVLQDAAVVGRVFWTGVVGALGGLSSGEVRDALGRLRVKELVLRIDPPSFSDELEFTFRHALIRDGAYESLPKALRAAKHGEVARWAQMKAGDRAGEIAELIATHDLEALRYLDELGETTQERAGLEASGYRWARAAGDRAAALRLPGEACRWYREALRLAETVGIPVADRAEIARALTRAAYGTRPTDETEWACRTALTLFEEAGDELGAGWAQSWLVLILLQKGHADEALAIGERAVERLEPFGETPEFAGALRQLGQFHWRRGDSAEADAFLRRAVEMAARVDAPDVRAAAMHDLGVNLSFTGHTKEAIETLELAFQLAKEVDDPINLQRIYNNLTSTLADFASDYERAREIGSEGLEMARKGGGTGWLAWIEGTLGEISLNLGELDDAERTTRRSLENAIAAGDEPLTGMRYAILGAVLLLRGRLEEAEAATGRSRQILKDNPEPQGEIPLAWVAGELAMARGRDEEALLHLRRAVEIASRYNVDQDPQVEVALVRLSIRRGERAEAEYGRDVLMRGTAPFALACIEVVHGLLADEPDEAVRRLRDATDRMEALGTRIDLALALLDLGRAERRVGADSRPTFTRAREVLVACDAQLYIRAVDAELEAEGR